MHTFRRMHAFGPNSMWSPGSSEDVRYRIHIEEPNSNVEMMKQTNVKFVRLWVWWSLLQPFANIGPGDPVPGVAPDDPDARDYFDNATPPEALLSLDDQVTFMRTRHDTGITDRNVVLTIWRFPAWSNVDGRTTAAPNAIHYEGEEPNLYPANNLAFPDDLSVEGPWADFVYFLIRRYTRTASNPNRWIDALEIVNEPNGQCWPQGFPAQGTDPSDPNGENVPTAYCDVVAMMTSALTRRDQAMADLTNAGQPPIQVPILMAPATDDYFGSKKRDGTSVTDTAARTSYSSFTNDLAGSLAATNWIAPRDFIWTHHNYNDVQYDLGPGTVVPSRYSEQQGEQCTGINRAGLVQDLLTGRWNGGPYGDPEVPYVFITEGGVTRGKRWKRVWWNDENYSDADGMNWLQGNLISKSLGRMQNEAEGQGIGMVAQYLNWTSPHYDSGIRDVPDPTGAKRQPAYDNWSAGPSHPRWGD